MFGDKSQCWRVAKFTETVGAGSKLRGRIIHALLCHLVNILDIDKSRGKNPSNF